jgi:hypothetical protein
MKKLLALLPLLAASASATPCTSTQYDMLSWFAMGSSWSQQYHLAGNANSLSTYRSNRVFYWIKAPSGYPWDVNYYDNSYIYQWATEYNWTDPTSYKAFNSTTTMPWSPRCVDKPAVGVYGNRAGFYHTAIIALHNLWRQLHGQLQQQSWLRGE